MNFIIKETSYKEEQEQIRATYEHVKKDYMAGLSRAVIQAAYNIGDYKWDKIYVPLLKKEGVYRKRKHVDMGVKNVYKRKNKQNKIIYQYVFYEDGVRRTRTSKDFNVLMRRVIEQGLEWIITDPEIAKKEGLIL